MTSERPDIPALMFLSGATVPTDIYIQVRCRKYVRIFIGNSYRSEIQIISWLNDLKQMFTKSEVNITLDVTCDTESPV